MPSEKVRPVLAPAEIIITPSPELSTFVDTYSEAWRHECEVRYVANKPNNPARAEYLLHVEQKRGKPAADKLRVDTWDRIRGKR